MNARRLGALVSLAFGLSACPAVLVAELRAPASIAPGEPFTVVAQLRLSEAVAGSPRTPRALAGRAHLAVRVPVGFEVRGAYLVGDDEHTLTSAPIVSEAYRAAHPGGDARWFGFVTRLHTGLSLDATVRVRLRFTAAATLTDESAVAFGAGLAPSYPGWPNLPAKLRVLTLKAKPR